jgi:hypothetical protein
LQNNEAEALRSWRSALDQIYYHNAYRVPPNYQPQSQTEKALQESLRDMEMQCKERVDLLEALRNSRLEAQEAVDKSTDKASHGHTLQKSSSMSKTTSESTTGPSTGWLGHGTVPPINYPDLSRPGPALPQRPKLSRPRSSESQKQRGLNGSQSNLTHLPPSSYISPSTTQPPKDSSRTPSPEKRNRLRTTLRPSGGGKDAKRPSKSRESVGRKVDPPAASKAAGLAWDSISKSSGQRLRQGPADRNGSNTTINSVTRGITGDTVDARRLSAHVDHGNLSEGRSKSFVQPPTPPDLLSFEDPPRPSSYHERPVDPMLQVADRQPNPYSHNYTDLLSLEPHLPQPLKPEMSEGNIPSRRNKAPPPQAKASSDYLNYRNEYPTASPAPQAQLQTKAASKQSKLSSINSPLQRSPPRKPRKPVPPPPRHNSAASIASPHPEKPTKVADAPTTSSDSDVDTGSGTPDSGSIESAQWEERVAYIKKHLPKGVDENAAKQIFNEIVVHGDPVRWDDVAGLEPAKKALKEAVVYPFLRPDLFMGLREPARGMLLFGPPGTGKTMLARAVATESRSTFFAISASSLTSKWLGESEKLVRALFALAKALAPSIIFVDEIDSLLSSRGGSSEHESTRRIKTEFLIQWSDLQRAAAGKEQTEKEKKEGDATRVLVLAATNLPWAIDEAARRRFVRRQYIPLPEGHVKATQLRTLLGHQKHNLTEADIEALVELTDGKFFKFRVLRNVGL